MSDRDRRDRPDLDRPDLDRPDLDRLTFEELVEVLEDLTRRMAAGEVGIEEAADLYEQAGVLHRAATDRLAQVQSRLAGLAGLTGDGGGEGQVS